MLVLDFLLSTLNVIDLQPSTIPKKDFHALGLEFIRKWVWWRGTGTQRIGAGGGWEAGGDRAGCGSRVREAGEE